MPSVRAAHDSEIGTICEFLATHMDPTLTAEQFRRLFDYPWLPGKPNLGFVLEDDGRIVGFLSTIYSEREIRGTVQRFCNLSSWFVLPEYRNQSLSLLAAVHRQRDLVFTNLTSRPTVQNISRAMRYELLDTYKLFAFPGTHLWTLLRTPPSLLSDPDRIEPLLTEPHRKFLRDHRGTKCRHLLVRRGDRYCYIIWTRRVKKLVPFCDVLFVSDPALLREHFELVKLAICVRGQALAMAIDERLLGARLPFVYPYERPALFKGSRVDRGDIDNLYSELALL